jgi:dihydroneopterin aldolase
MVGARRPLSTHILTLSRMRFAGRHGVYTEERLQGQAFEATVSLELPAHAFDNLSAVIDYCAVQAVVGSVMEGPARQLIETLAEDVAAALLSSFPSALSVEVEVFKPNPPVPFRFDGVSVRLKRSR